MLVKQLLNHGENNLYAVDATDHRFTITPSETVRNCLEYSSITGSFEGGKRIISIPVPNMPIFVPEMGLMVYATPTERDEAIQRFGSGRLLVNTMYSNQMPLMQGSYKVIVNLSDNDYYFLNGKNVYKLPKYDHNFRSQYIANGSIPIEKLDSHDLIVVATILRHDSVDRPVLVSYEDQFVPKNLWTEDPILFVTNGMILFKTQSAAEKFQQKYDDFADYFIDKSLEAVEEKHRKDLEKMAEDNRRERSSIMKNAILLAGTTIVGVVAEKVITWLLTKDDNKSKIIVGAVSSIIRR